MASEDAVWKALYRVMQGVHINRVENIVEDGMPDVNGCEEGTDFWVELKQLDEWPKRASTKVKVGIRPSQLRWIADRGKAGGNVYVLAKVEDVYLLFWWRSVGKLYEGMVKEDLVEEALLATKRLNKLDLLRMFARKGFDYGKTLKDL